MIRDTISNLFGIALPAVVAVVSIPLLIGKMGPEMFGVFSLQIAILFFLGISDFGISKAIVLLSFNDSFTDGSGWRRPFQIGWYYSAILALILTFLGALTWVLSDVEIRLLSPEILRSTGIIIVSSALMLITLPFRAIYEVEHRFLLLNLIKGPAAASLFLAPFIGFHFEVSLESTAWSIFATRLLFLFAFVALSGFRSVHKQPHACPILSVMSSRERKELFLRRAFALGVTNFSVLLLTYMDRFLIAAMVSAVAVSHYVISQEVVSKLWLVVGAAIIASVPKLASAKETKGRQLLFEKIRELKILVVMGGLLPAIALVIFADQILRLWLQQSYTPESTLPLQIMAIGVGMNSLSQVNFSLLQVFGGEARGAILQVGNLIFAFVSLLVLIYFYSIIGAAVAFTIRMALDAIAVRILLDQQIKNGRDFGVKLRALLLVLTFIIVVFAGVHNYESLH